MFASVSRTRMLRIAGTQGRVLGGGMGPGSAAHRKSAALRPGHESAAPSVSFPAKAGNPVRRGFSVSHWRLWNTGLPAFAGN